MTIRIIPTVPPNAGSRKRDFESRPERVARLLSRKLRRSGRRCAAAAARQFISPVNYVSLGLRQCSIRSRRRESQLNRESQGTFSLFYEAAVQETIRSASGSERRRALDERQKSLRVSWAKESGPKAATFNTIMIEAKR